MLGGSALEGFRRNLQRFLLRRLRSRDTAEDLAQEVFLRLLRFADHKLVEHPQAYVYQVAFNVLCEFKLDERRSVVSFDSQAADEGMKNLPDEALSPEDSMDRLVHERQLDEWLERLPAMQRAVFLLAVRHGLPHAEIAEKLGLSLHTVRKYLYRATHICRQQLVGE